MISCDLILEVVSGGRILTALSFPDSSIPFFFSTNKICLCLDGNIGHVCILYLSAVGMYSVLGQYCT